MKSMTPPAIPLQLDDALFDLSIVTANSEVRSRSDCDDTESCEHTSTTSLASSLQSPSSLDSFTLLDDRHSQLMKRRSGESLRKDVLSNVDFHSSSEHGNVTTQLRRKRRLLEDWHNQQKKETVQRQVLCYSESVSLFVEKHDKDALPKNAARTHRGSAFSRLFVISQREEKGKRMDRDERKRYQRIVDRLLQAKGCLNVRHLELENHGHLFVDTRRQIHANKARATTKLRLSQVDRALEYYQQRLASKTSPAKAVPMEVLKVVSSLADLTKRTLHDDLEHALASLCDQRPEELRQAMAVARQLRMMGLEKRGPAIGDTMPHFNLLSSTGEHFDSRLLSGNGKIVVVVYLGHWSTLCLATLRAWRDQYTTLLQNARGVTLPIIAVGTETTEGCKKTARKTGAVFPILSDPNGDELLKPLGLLIGGDSGPSHPMTTLQPSPEFCATLPMTATLVVDIGHWTLLYSHVTLDVGVRAEPMEIISSFFLDLND